MSCNQISSLEESLPKGAKTQSNKAEMFGISERCVIPMARAPLLNHDATFRERITALRKLRRTGMDGQLPKRSVAYLKKSNVMAGAY